MISNSKKFIFIHIPKVGGTSIQEELSEFGTVLHYKVDSIYFKHATASDCKKNLNEEYDNFFKFAFVRNPWDWVVSNYTYNRGIHWPFVKGTRYPAGGPKTVPAEINNMNFKTWLKWWTTELNPSQHRLICDKDNNLLVDFIGKFENLQKDFNYICNKMGIKNKILGHHKVSNRKKDYKEYYDEETKKIVEHFFKIDIKMFNYKY